MPKPKLDRLKSWSGLTGPLAWDQLLTIKFVAQLTVCSWLLYSPGGPLHFSALQQSEAGLSFPEQLRASTRCACIFCQFIDAFYLLLEFFWGCSGRLRKSYHCSIGQ